MSLLTDLRLALRLQRRQPGLALSAIIVLGLGLAGNLTVVSLFNSTLFEPMPGIHDVDNLVLLGSTRAGNGFRPTSYPDYTDLRHRVRSLQYVAAQQPLALSFADANGTERVSGAAVSDNYFDALHTRIQKGRGFRGEEERGGPDSAVIVISDWLWQQRWGRDPRAIGASVLINAVPVTIVGVAEPAFRGNWLPAPADIWAPLSLYERLDGSFAHLAARDATWLSLFGRLAPGVSRTQADAELRIIGAALAPLHSRDLQNLGYRTARFNSTGEAVDGGEVAHFLTIMSAITLLGLLVVCANVANLMLARASARQREIAIRLSIGAGRGRVVRQMLAEGFVLACAGLLLAALAAQWGVEWLAAVIPNETGDPIHLEAHWNSILLSYAAILAVLSTAAFALPAALQSVRTDLQSILKTGEAGAASGRSRLRQTFAIAQIAFCLLLLATAGLLTRSVYLLNHSDQGFDMQHIVLASVDLAANGYSQESGKALFVRLQERLQRTPGVESAALARMTALSGSSMSLFGVYGGALPKTGQLYPYTNIQSPGYFDTVGLPLLDGRDFSARDTANSAKVAVINERLAQLLFPGQRAVGQILRTSDKNYPAFEIIGVVRNGLGGSAVQTSQPALHLNLQQTVNWNLTQTIHVRARDTAAAFKLIRDAVAEQDRNVPVYHLSTARAAFEQSYFPQRLGSRIAGLSALMAVLVAAIGLYGLIAFQVNRRTREIGLRMALGASATTVWRSIVYDSLRLLAGGITIGLLLSAALTRLLASLLYGVRPAEPAILAAGVAILALAALAAAWFPARRAMQIDPASALRYE